MIVVAQPPIHNNYQPLAQHLLIGFLSGGRVALCCERYFALALRQSKPTATAKQTTTATNTATLRRLAIPPNVAKPQISLLVKLP
jgi:hypothetical protein